ncbi:unnamed protein product [Prunus brigantina]
MASAPETVVMVTQGQRGPQISTDGSSHTKVIGSHPEHKFTHCGGSKHTCAGCYELIGPAVSTTPAPAFTSVATTGTQGYVLHSSSKKHTWIIDTGATDHMTFDPGRIASHTPSPQSMVSNANGEVSSKFQQFYQMMETQFHARIQILCSNNGGEFLNHDLNKFLQDHGIIH